MSSVIEVTGLDKHFGDFHAVKDISFIAEGGGITALLGPSGSGKSTVLRMIAGLEHPDEGRIILGGKELTNKSVQERSVGFVFQHYALFRHMTVWDNVAFGLDVRKESKSTIRRRVDELLLLVQLSPFASRYPDNLSGGQRQRVALARALAPRPEVLLLDEPFGALDARVRQDLRRWLDELHREIGVTSLLVTHDQEEALELANKVIVMHEGGIEQIGTPDEIYNEPATPFIAGFVGAANVLHGFVINGQVQFGELFPAGGRGPAGWGDGRGVRPTSRHRDRPHEVRTIDLRGDHPSRQQPRVALEGAAQAGRWSGDRGADPERPLQRVRERGPSVRRSRPGERVLERRRARRLSGTRCYLGFGSRQRVRRLRHLALHSWRGGSAGRERPPGRSR